jgi:hypothetical protein
MLFREQHRHSFGRNSAGPRADPDDRAPRPPTGTAGRQETPIGPRRGVNDAQNPGHPQLPPSVPTFQSCAML